MPPQQPYLPQPSYTPPPQQNYDFIMNPQKGRRLNNFFDGSPKSLVIMAGAFIGIIIIIFIIYEAAKPASLTPQIANLAATQAEIVRVAVEASGSNNLNDQSTKNLAASVAASVGTEQNNLVALLASGGVKLSNKTLASKQNPATDQELNNASQSGNYDSTFVQIVQSELTGYNNQLASIYRLSKSQKLKSQLATDFSDAQLLLTQAKAGG